MKNILWVINKEYGDGVYVIADTIDSAIATYRKIHIRGVLSINHVAFPALIAEDNIKSMKESMDDSNQTEIGELLPGCVVSEKTS